MASRQSAEVRLFFRVALQRYEVAEILLTSNRTTGAIYLLAGYTVECLLKALLSSQVPLSRHNTLVQSFRGNVWHSYDWLKKELRTHGSAIPMEVARSLLRVNTWTTHLRYLPGRKKREEAIAFLEAVDPIVRWVKRSIGYG